MAPQKTKKTTKPEHLNPLEAYTTAIETLMAAATGKTRSRIRIEAATTLLSYTDAPPHMKWDCELEEDD